MTALASEALHSRGGGVRLPLLIAALVIGAGTMGCSASGHGHGQATAPDTLSGTVLVVGADPVAHPVLETADGQLRLEGPVDLLQRVHGLGVEVFGRRDETALHVARFRVVAADGLPAADGTLEVRADTAVLVTPDGDRQAYTPVPAALLSHVGARVWIAGESGREPQAWGVIEE